MAFLKLTDYKTGRETLVPLTNINIQAGLKGGSYIRFDCGGVWWVDVKETPEQIIAAMEEYGVDIIKIEREKGETYEKGNYQI